MSEVCWLRRKISKGTRRKWDVSIESMSSCKRGMGLLKKNNDWLYFTACHLSCLLQRLRAAGWQAVR